mgnify:CR=1 FL=1
MTQARIGLIGLGTMGAALALNIAEKGFPIAVWNRTTEVTRAFAVGAGVLAPWVGAAADIHAIWPPHHRQSPRVRAFADFLAARFAAQRTADGETATAW